MQTILKAIEFFTPVYIPLPVLHLKVAVSSSNHARMHPHIEPTLHCGLQVSFVVPSWRFSLAEVSVLDTHSFSLQVAERACVVFYHASECAFIRCSPAVTLHQSVSPDLNIGLSCLMLITHQHHLHNLWGNTDSTQTSSHTPTTKSLIRRS